MTPYTLTLASPLADLETAGGKGMSLARMLQAGLPVPGGFHITTAAYCSFVAANHLQQPILTALAGLDSASPTDQVDLAAQAIAGLFLAGEVPAEVAAEITAASVPFGVAALAVRSSATAEDLPGVSFAGQQETYLNIHGSAALLRAVRQCWASLWTARAITYRAMHHIDPASVALAVVVQELVAADAAGILFTANPLSGARGEVLINAAWGLGEAVVSGAVTPDTLKVNKASGKVIQRETVEKLVMTVRTDQGTAEQPVPPALRKKAVLSAKQAAELAGWGSRIEALYGMPMDIEWALAQGKFAILQARPITALPPQWVGADAKAMYARGSLAEHIPGPATPLFATLGLEIANQATLRMWEKMVGKDSASLMVGGRFYQPLNGYVYGAMRMDGKQMVSVIKMSLSVAGPMFRQSVPRWRAAQSVLADVVAEWEQRPIESFTPAQLLEGVRVVFGAACRYFTDLQTTLPAASSSEVLFTTLYDRLVKRKGDPKAAVFLLGFETAALRADKALFAIADWLKQHPDLAAYVQAAPAAELLRDLAQAEPRTGIDPAPWQEWRGCLVRYLAEFGRSAYDFDFSNPTLGETPQPILEAIKAYLSGQAADPGARQRATAERREQATHSVLARLGWPLKGWFTRLLRWAQETAPMREDGIAAMGLGHPLVRRMLAGLGSRFVAGGAIASPEQIYWLEQAEVEQLIAALDSGAALPDMTGCIPPRKVAWEAALKLSPPVMIPEKSVWARMFPGGEASQHNGQTVLNGLGTSSGTVTAPACILFSPQDFARMRPGDVLVAVTTTPAWTPLFALASAVVTDIGGPLSHSSIVAREYGIPAVMAAKGATHHIRPGQMVTVDGSAGKVTLLE